MTRTATIVLLALLGGCATSHTLQAAPAPDADAPAFEGQCLAWAHPEGLPEDVRCVEWASGDAGAPTGCRIAPFDRQGPQAGACAR